jgi:hypothetical protein
MLGIKYMYQYFMNIFLRMSESFWHILGIQILVPYFSDHRPLLFFSDKLAAAHTPNEAYLLFYEV